MASIRLRAAAELERRRRAKSGIPGLSARDDLLTYTTTMNPDYQPGRLHRHIAEHLVKVERGEIKRLILTVPPQHGKSTLASGSFPSWYLGRSPQKNVIFTTYAQDYASDWGSTVRNTLLDPEHQRIFPDCRPRGDSASSTKVALSKGGRYFAVGAGGPITGRNAHLILIDDPVKGMEEAESAAVQKKVREWYNTTLYTRRSPDAAIVVIQTRWVEYDLTGWLLETHARQNWVVVNLPALADPTPECPDPLGRAPGEPLWPERYNAEFLADVQATLTSRQWSALYQQRPQPATGGLIKEAWFRYYGDGDYVSSDPVFRVWAWDTAVKTKEWNDYSAGSLIEVWPDGYVVRHMIRERVEFPELKRLIRDAYESWPANGILVEDASSGQQVIQELQRETNLPIIPAPAGKLLRTELLTPTYEAGKLILPKDHPLTPVVVAEAITFPVGSHDDLFDSQTLALDYLVKRIQVVQFGSVKK